MDAFERTLEDLSKDEKHFDAKERRLIHTILLTYRFFMITRMIDEKIKDATKMMGEPYATEMMDEALTNIEKKEDDDDGKE